MPSLLRESQIAHHADLVEQLIARLDVAFPLVNEWVEETFCQGTLDLVELGYGFPDVHVNFWTVSRYPGEERLMVEDEPTPANGRKPRTVFEYGFGGRGSLPSLLVSPEKLAAGVEASGLNWEVLLTLLSVHELVHARMALEAVAEQLQLRDSNRWVHLPVMRRDDDCPPELLAHEELALLGMKTFNWNKFDQRDRPTDADLAHYYAFVGGYEEYSGYFRAPDLSDLKSDVLLPAFRAKYPNLFHAMAS